VTKNETTPKGQDRKQFTAIDWEPYEISLTMVPADAGAVLMKRRGPQGRRTKSLKPRHLLRQPTRAISPKEQEPMENATITAGAGARSEESAAARASWWHCRPWDEQKLRDEAVSGGALAGGQDPRDDAAVPNPTRRALLS